MLVRLLVLIALAVALGELREAAEVVDSIAGQVSLIEAEPEPASDSIVVTHPLVLARPPSVGVHARAVSPPACSMDASGVFRPPRSRTA